MTCSDVLPPNLAKCGRGKLCRCDNLQPSHFVTVKTWNYESFSFLQQWQSDLVYQKHQHVSEMTWIDIKVQIKEHKFFWLLLWLQHSHAVRNGCKRVKAAQGLSQTNSQVFCLPLSSLTAADSQAISFEGSLDISVVGSMQHPVTAEQRCPQVTSESFQGIKEKIDWRVPRRLTIVC